MKIKEITDEPIHMNGSGKKAKKRKALADMSVDEMFSMIDEEGGTADDASSKKKGKKKEKLQNKRKKKSPREEDEESDIENGNVFETDLKKQEEEAMQSDEESDGSDIDDEPNKTSSKNVVNAAMLEEWTKELRGNKPLNAFMHLREAFLGALQSLDKSEDAGKKTVLSRYIVLGSEMFNAIIRVCLKYIPSAFFKILRLKNPSDDPAKSKRWNKMSTFFKGYLVNLIKLVSAVADPAAAEVLLSRGVIPLLSYYAGVRTIVKKLLRKLISLWATSEKKVRVLAFICIFRLTRKLPSSYLTWILSAMYKTYVINTKFTSPHTWGVIDFMRMSLVELYALDQPFAYKQGFVYIRQMAVQLRNAVHNASQEKVQAVYNWQYIHCLHLWADLLAKMHPSTILQPLIYPLIQVAIGTMQLQPTPAFYPVVFHICDILSDLSRQTGTFIPVVPHLLEILLNAPLHKPHKKASIRPFNWKCMLRVSSKEMQESGFKDGIISQIYGGIITYLSAESHSIAFPELAFPALVQIKQFIRVNKTPNFTRKMTQLVEKIQENCNFIDSRRRNTTLRMTDTKAIKDWEISVRQEGTPLNKFFQTWKKIQEQEYQRTLVSEVEMTGHELPVMKKEEAEGKRPALLPDSDEEDDDDSEIDESEIDESSEEEEQLSKNQKRKQKKQQKKQQQEKEEEEEEEDETSAPKKVTFDELSKFDDGTEDEIRVMSFAELEDDDDEVDDYGAESD